MRKNIRVEILFAVVGCLAFFFSAECVAQNGFSSAFEIPGESSSDESPTYISRLSASHRFGEGLGFTDGYTTLEWMMPTYDNWDDKILFFDGRLIISDEDFRLGSNTGLVFRKYDSATNRIYGAMAYYDTRYFDSYVFQQVATGVETLGQYVDARAMLYLPVPGADTHSNSSQFAGNRFVIGSQTDSMSGATAEIGVNSPWFGDFQFSGFVGGYHFETDDLADIDGISGRAEVRVRDQFQVDLTVQDDDVFGQTASVGVTISQLFRMRGHAARKSMSHKFRGYGNNCVDARLGERVRRLENILVREVRAEGPAIGTDENPYNFLHVIDGGMGDGSFETPFGSIADATSSATAGDPNTIVYVRGDGSFTDNVVLLNRMKLLSNGPVQTFSTQIGDMQLPFSGSNTTLEDLPVLDGNLMLAESNMVSGFDIMGAVTGDDADGSMIMNSTIQSGTDAINLTNSQNVTLENLVLRATGSGIQLTDSEVTATDVTVAAAGDDGVEVNAVAGPAVFNATNLNIDVAGNQGVDLNATAGQLLTANIDGGSIVATNNAFDANSGNVASQLELSLDNTTLSSASGIAVSLQNASTAMLTVNSFEGNTITNADAGGVNANRVTFNALTVDSLSIGNAVMGPGLSLQESTGSLTITNLAISNSNGAGLVVENAVSPLTLTTGPTSTISTQGGAALDLTGPMLTSNLSFASLATTDSATNGIQLDGVMGTLTSLTTTINDAAVVPDPILVTNSPMTFTVDLGTTTVGLPAMPLNPSNVNASGNGGFLSLSGNGVVVVTD